MDSIDGNNNQRRKVAIYIRVSTAEQKMDGYSTEAQRKRLLSYVRDNLALNLQTKEEWIFEDTHTGSDLNRPQLQRLLEEVKQKKFDAVLVWKIDRLSRSLKHLLMIFDQLEENEASFISLQENIDFRGPIGKLIFQIFGAIAQFERELIKGRTKMGKITSAELGNFTGTSIPYGYAPLQNDGGKGKGKKIFIIPEEREMVVKIFDWYIFDEMGYGQISAHLNKLNVPKGRYAKERHANSPWSISNIKSIIENTIYRGEFVANKTDDSNSPLPEDQWTIVAIPPCIGEVTFLQAQMVRSTREGATKGETYLLSGKLRDISIEPSKAFCGKKRIDGGYSYCRKQFDDKAGNHYPVFEVPAKQIEDYVWGKVLEAVSDPEVFIQSYLSLEYKNPDKVSQLEGDLARLRAASLNEDLAMERIEVRFENGKMPEDMAEKRIQERQSSKDQIEAQIQELEAELQVLSSIDSEVLKLQDASDKVKYHLDNLSDRNKRLLCDLFIERVEMTRKPKVSEGYGRKQRWDVSGQIHFRFNPSKFITADGEGRIEKQLTQAEKETSKLLKRQNGGRSKT